MQRGTLVPSVSFSHLCSPQSFVFCEINEDGDMDDKNIDREMGGRNKMKIERGGRKWRERGE